MNGSDVLVLVQTGANPGPPPTPIYTVVGSQRDVTFDETNEVIDLSSKGSRSFQGLAGRYSATLSLDALYVPSDQAYKALKSAARSGSPVVIVRREGETQVEKASAIITSMSESFPDQDAATISIDFQIIGDWQPMA